MKFMANTRLRGELLRRIAEHCQKCAADHDPEGCADGSCSLWNARLGALEARRGATWLLARVRERCGECTGQDARNLLLCNSYTCSLWEWRQGTKEPAKKPKDANVSDVLFDDSGEEDIEDILFG
uniref:Uncharacterized protein n=1 Tax=viral metagenome TaxID=1070528 RepID=A0A6H2A1C7_9ZZZZ